MSGFLKMFLVYKLFDGLCQYYDFSFQRKMNNSEFNKNAASVATNIQKLVQNVSSMQRMLVHVDSQGEGLRQQLAQLQHYTGQLARDTADQLKRLADTQPPGDAGAKIQRERLQEEFTRALDNFQRVQREAIDKERQKLEAAKQDSEVSALPGPGEVGRQGRTQMMLEEEDRLKELEDRERAMRQLESDITDVNTIFKVRQHTNESGVLTGNCPGPRHYGPRAGGSHRQHREQHREHDRPGHVRH